MNQKWILSLPVVLLITILLFTGEMVAGTRLQFASLASMAVLFACLTYNTLGGMGSMSGIAYARFALSTLVVGQVGKALLLEKADQNLDVPQLVISVYALYFFSAMVGVMLLSRIRLPFPKPVEPETPTQSKYLYIVSLAGGLLGSLILFLSLFRGESGTTSLEHGVGLILSYLLPFSMVLAVDHRIRATHGLHSFGWMASWPALAMEVQGFLTATRISFAEPFAILFLTCYLRDFHFKRRHFAAAAALIVVFFVFVSPYYLYARAYRESATPGELAHTMIHTLELAPSEWSTIQYQVGSAAADDPRAVNYFSTPGAVTLNRFALIGPDSTLISACATGYHYAFISIELDVLSAIPRFLYRNKPDVGSDKFLGQLDGQEVGATAETTYSTITPIADSYGGFGWLGAVVFPFFVLPAVFIVYEGIFDMRKPWGTVAAVSLLLGFTEGSMGHIILDDLIKNPIYLLLLSWASAWIVRMIPSTGDGVPKMRALRNRAAVSAGEE